MTESEPNRFTPLIRCISFNKVESGTKEPNTFNIYRQVSNWCTVYSSLAESTSRSVIVVRWTKKENPRTEKKEKRNVSKEMVNVKSYNHMKRCI